MPTGGVTDHMIEAARHFVEQPTGLIVLYGGSGNAKSHVLKAIVNELIVKRRIGAVYMRVWDLMNYVRDGVKQNAADDDIRRLERLQHAPVLCLDELDKIRQDTEFMLSLQRALLDRRYEDATGGVSGTVIAMNLSPDEAFEPHIASRLLDKRNTVIHNTDLDMRRRRE